MNYRMLLSTALAAVIVVAACGDTSDDASPSSTDSTSPTTAPSGGATSSDLVGTRWIVDGLTIGGADYSLVPDADPTIEFSADQPTIGGTTGCNSYFAEVEYLAGGELRIGGVGQTEMACFPQEVMDQEAQFGLAISQVEFYELDGDRLTLASLDGSVIISAVNRDSVVMPVELGGVTWIADTRIERDAASTLVGGNDVTLTFDMARGNIGGNSGCNQFGATFVIDDDRIRVADLVGTEIACEEPVMEQQRFLYDVLLNADTFNIDDRRLTILTADGRGISLVASDTE
ncbi:MAG: META domain-containing protein [Acidimicrobiia bacterium]|nr:META domain-containing protein [Acidimicrobiia bacterium]